MRLLSVEFRKYFSLATFAFPLNDDQTQRVPLERYWHFLTPCCAMLSVAKAVAKESFA